MQSDTTSIKNQVLFVTYGGGHAAALSPVITSLLNQSVSCQTLALTTAYSALVSKGLKPFSMANVADDVRGYRGVRRIGKLLAGCEPNHSSVSREESEAYLGVGFHSMVRSLGLQEARAIYQTRGRQSFCPTNFFYSWFDQERPSLVVATSAPRSERAALEAARDLGIPSVCVVDLYAPFEIEWCASPGFASIICVLNEVVAKRFTDRGVPTERIVVTGNPSFDRLAHLDFTRLRHTARKAMGVKDNEKIISWMSQPEPLLHPFSGSIGNPLLPIQIERHLVKGILKRPNVNLVFRHHPSEDRTKDFLIPRVHYSNSTQPLDELLCASDCVVTCSSTVGLEAALLGIPVVQCMDSIFSPDLPLAGLGIALEVERHELLWPVLDKVLNSSLRRKSNSVQHHEFLLTQMSSTDKISNLIIKLLGHT